MMLTASFGECTKRILTVLKQNGIKVHTIEHVLFHQQVIQEKTVLIRFTLKCENRRKLGRNWVETKQAKQNGIIKATERMI